MIWATEVRSKPNSWRENDDAFFPPVSLLRHLLERMQYTIEKNEETTKL